MQQRRRHTITRVTAGIALGAATLAATPAVAAAPTQLRLNGIGPLRLGMPLAAARATGWIAHPVEGCELATPRPVVYRLDGRGAPAGLSGTVEFFQGRLTQLSVGAGVRTALGVRPGTTSWRAMVGRYRAAGFTVTANVDPTFQARFVDVFRRGRLVLQASTEGSKVAQLAVPSLAFCE